MADGLVDKPGPRSERVLQPTEGASAPGDAADEASSVAPGRPWSELWQVPTILLSLMLIAAGLVVGMQRGAKDDFEGALSRVEAMIAEGRMEEASHGLSHVLEPNLDIASVPERARFHASVADWIAITQQMENVDRAENNRRIHEQYQRAVDLALRLTPERIERWGHAQISLGMIEEARRRLSELDASSLPDASEMGGGERRARLFRRIIERMLADVRRGAAGGEDHAIVEMLREYRREHAVSEGRVSPAALSEKVWAIARHAEVLLAMDRALEAVDQLLIDMRRVEHLAQGAAIGINELYAILGRAYFELGQFERARLNLERALVDISTGSAAGGTAHVLLGRLAASEGDLSTALGHFETALEDFGGPGASQAALLGRAEVHSALGQHETSREDYRHLAQQVRHAADFGAVTPVRVAASLVDRHDAAMARGDLQTALSYASIAELLFERADVPVDVLLRIATTSRQIADDLTEDLAHRPEADREQVIKQRYRANVLHRQAGEYFARHARMLVAVPGRDDDWAASLWNAADSFDLGGYYELAIEHFEEYLAGRSQQDPRRSDGMFRLARCFHALTEYDRAAEYYERVIAEHPRSTVATESYVPLAKCYVAIGQRSKAEQLLNQVLAGLLPIQPSAIDYRNALVAMADIHYQQGNFGRAITHYREASLRYPDDSQILQIRFRLADSQRNLAVDIWERLQPPSPESLGNRRRLEEQKRENLREAMEGFAWVCASYDDRGAGSIGGEMQDLHRLSKLYHADCAFMLADYERAVALYERAAHRYASHHSSMYAMVQIVNAYSAMGKAREAHAAHKRALAKLDELKENVFGSDDALMNRQAWERWLQNTPVLPHTAMTSVDVP